MTSPKPIENKFKLGERVKVKGRDVDFIVGSIQHLSFGNNVVYADDRRSLGPYYESDLELVKEPLRAEFECEWHLQPAYGPRIDISTLKPFIGKRTRVVIEEIVEET